MADKGFVGFTKQLMLRSSVNCLLTGGVGGMKTTNIPAILKL